MTPLIAIISIYYLLNKQIFCEYSIFSSSPSICKNKKSLNNSFFFNSITVSCESCFQTLEFQRTSDDGLSCVCQPGYKYIRDHGKIIECQKCPDKKIPSSDGWDCISCQTGILYPPNSSSSPLKCKPCESDSSILIERNLNGDFSKRLTTVCSQCASSTKPDSKNHSCVFCLERTNVYLKNCLCPYGKDPKDFLCYMNRFEFDTQMITVDYLTTTIESMYLKQNVRRVIDRCGVSYNKNIFSLGNS